MPSSTSASRATVSDIEIRMSLVSTRVKAYNVVNTADDREVKFELICPVCMTAHVDQVYHCQAGCLPDDDHPAERGDGWRPSEIPVRGRWEGDALVATATVEEVEAQKQAAREDAGVDEKTLELAFHPAAQVEATTAEVGNSYCLLPQKGTADAFYQVLLTKAADPDLAIIAAFVVKKNVNVYRLHASPHGLLLRELTRPEQTHSFAVELGKAPSDKERAMFEGLVAALTDDFRPEDYASGRTAKLRELIAVKAGVDLSNVTPITKASKAKPADDLEATLKAALAMAKSKTA